MLTPLRRHSGFSKAFLRHALANTSDPVARFATDHRQLSLYTFLTLLTLICSQAIADNSSVKLSTGAEYITGNYGGTKSIDQLYIPVTMRYSIDRYSYRLTIPYTTVNAPSDTILSDGTVIPGSGDLTTESGIGDVIVAATYRDLLDTETTSDLAIDLTARIKFGTASTDKNLGSGEDDYTLQADVYRFFDRTTLFGTLGYKLRGDPPGIDLDNSLILFIGGNHRLTPDYKFGMDLYYQQSSISGLDDQMELSESLGYWISRTRYLRGYLIQGLSDASPDWGAGFYITFIL
jgi:hypothetical protein